MAARLCELQNDTGLWNELASWFPIACGIFGADGALTFCNESWAAFFCIGSRGAAAFDELLDGQQPCGKGSREFMRESLAGAQAAGEASFEFFCSTACRHELYADLHCKPLRGGSFFVLATVASQRAIEAETKRLAAEDESRAKTRFLARMSHEIRTPMNAVIGITEVQLFKGGHAPETTEAFARIYNSASMLISIINDILDFSKIEMNKLEIVESRYDMASLLVDTVQLNLMYIGGKSVSFKLDVDPATPSQLRGDQLRIRQILNNLLSNAFKYTSQGSVTLDVWHKPEPKNPGAVGLYFRVTDTGRGMTEEQKNEVFNLEFTRFNSRNSRMVEGTGLGMNIAWQLTRLMRGSISVESRLDAGTSFTVYLPQGCADARAIGGDTAANLQNFDNTERALKRIRNMRFTPMPYGRVLVVDDVESNLYVAKGLLMPYKLTVETADSGYAAVDKIKDGAVYDIIFMDHMMPGMSGIEAVKRIRDFGYTGTIIALTANNIAGQAETYMQNGFNGFISKPIDVNQMNANLLKFIRDVQPQDVLDAAGRDYVMAGGQQGDGAVPEEGPHEAGGVSPRVRESFARDEARARASIEEALGGLGSGGDPAAREESAKIYIIHIHALKSGLANIQEIGLSKIAAALEQAGRDSDFDTVKLLTPGFLARLAVAARKSEELARAEKPAAQEPARAANKDRGELAMDRIFVVDDSDTNLVLVEEALEEHYSVMTMPSAERMFKVLAKVKPALILLDVEMPVMNGLQALEALRQSPDTKDVKVALMTATVTDSVREAAEKFGVLGIMAKPFDPDALLAKTKEWAEGGGKETTVLIVDDTPMIISALTRILSPSYKVKAARDGEAGLRLAEEHDIDLILLDISMPKLSGFGVLERLKSSRKTADIPVIFITGSTEAEDEALGFSLGAVDYIRKPFTQESVLHRVGLHVGGGRQ